MADVLAVDQVTLAKVIDGGDIPEELVQEIHDASTNAAEAKADAAQAGITAVAARTAAEAAQTAASNAAKTATDYMYEVEGSLAVHPKDNFTDFTSIDSDSFDVYKNGQLAASFGEETSIKYVEVPTVEEQPDESFTKRIPLIKFKGADYNPATKKASAEVAFFDGLAKLSAQWLEALDYDPDRVYTTLSAFGLFLESQDKARFKGYGGEIEASAASSMGLFRGKSIKMKSDYGADAEASVEAGIDVNGKSYVNINAENIRVGSVNYGGDVGATAKLVGQTTTALTLSTTAKNLLTVSSAEITAGDDYYSFEQSGGITVKKNGIYFVRGCMYVTTGFTANDILHLIVYKNGAVITQMDKVHRMVSTGYQTIEVTGIFNLAEGDYLQLYGRNQTAARGNVQPSNVTQLGVIKLG